VAATVLAPEEDEDEAHAAAAIRTMAIEKRRRGTAVQLGRRVVDAGAMRESIRG
jgi:hypothetical protein